MSIIIKTPEQMHKINEAGVILGEVYYRLRSYIKPGVTTAQIDAFVDRFIKKHGASPTFKSVPGYRHATCISVNNEVVHGIPSKHKVIERGDIVCVDSGATLNGYIGDSTQTFLMPGASEKAKQLVEVTKKCLALGIEQCVIGNTVGDIGAAIQQYAESFGYGVVREYYGHGTGVELHEDPSIPHYGKAGTGISLKEGMVIAIEPMINEGTYHCRTLRDGWTVVTADGSLSCQWEHTVAITKDGPKILTDREIVL